MGSLLSNEMTMTAFLVPNAPNDPYASSFEGNIMELSFMVFYAPSRLKST